MEKLLIKIVLKNGVATPKYATELSAGFDLTAYSVIPIPNQPAHITHDGFSIPPQSRILVGTGLFIELPKGKVLDIRTRSGMALKEGVFVLNSPGTIDADYRGEIGVILYNTNVHPVFYKFGDRICQAVILDHYQAEFEVVESLSDTVRGDDGFGSSGK